MMQLLTWVSLFAIVATAIAHGSDYAKGTGCYDCNYAPSGYVKGFKYWREGAAEVGYMRCALTSPVDRHFLRKNPCASGRCYIRQEENGMVYRGCADTKNLPWDVNAEVNCKYQGPSKSLWWFCDGHACNDGQIGESEDRCGSPPTKAYDSTAYDEVVSEPQNDPTDYHEPVQYKSDHGAYHDHGAYADSGDYGGQGGYGHHGSNGYQRGYGNHGKYYNYDGYGSHGNYDSYGYNLENKYVDRVDPHLYDKYPLQAPDGGRYNEPAVVKDTAIAHKEYDPCDGNCEYNPSGLFPDPDRSNHFIQCGCAFKYGRPCTCCQKFYLACAPKSYYDDNNKVCVHPTKSH